MHTVVIINALKGNIVGELAGRDGSPISIEAALESPVLRVENAAYLQHVTKKLQDDQGNFRSATGEIVPAEQAADIPSLEFVPKCLVDYQKGIVTYIPVASVLSLAPVDENIGSVYTGKYKPSLSSMLDRSKSGILQPSAEETQQILKGSTNGKIIT